MNDNNNNYLRLYLSSLIDKENAQSLGIIVFLTTTQLVDITFYFILI